MQMWDKKGNLIYEGDSQYDMALALIRSVGDVPNVDSRVIKQNRSVLSSLSIAQAVSWLYVNKGIKITAENLQIELESLNENGK